MLGEARFELLATVVVVRAGGEPEAFEIRNETLPIGRSAVALVVGINLFEQSANAEVVTAVLVEKDIAALQGCFLEIIDKSFLFEREFFKALNAVAQHLDVGKLLVGVLKAVGSRLGCGGGEGSRCGE